MWNFIQSKFSSTGLGKEGLINIWVQYLSSERANFEFYSDFIKSKYLCLHKIFCGLH